MSILDKIDEFLGDNDLNEAVYSKLTPYQIVNSLKTKYDNDMGKVVKRLRSLYKKRADTEIKSKIGDALKLAGNTKMKANARGAMTTVKSAAKDAYANRKKIHGYDPYAKKDSLSDAERKRVDQYVGARHGKVHSGDFWSAYDNHRGHTEGYADEFTPKS